MASKHNFRKLEIWKLGISISKEIYAITATFPKSETYGLVNQLQRASVSISSNISEGTSRGTDKHFIQFLEAALGSAYEIETQLIIASEIGYVSEIQYEELEKQINKLQSMISKFIDNLKKS